VDRGLSPREATHGAWGPGKSPEKSQSPGGWPQRDSSVISC
jgi:hypothetical protein